METWSGQGKRHFSCPSHLAQPPRAQFGREKQVLARRGGFGTKSGKWARKKWTMYGDSVTLIKECPKNNLGVFGHCPNSNWTPPHSNGHYFRQYLTILKSCMLPDSSSHLRCLKPSWSPKRALTKYAQIVLRRGFPKTVLGLYIFQHSAAA